MLGGLGAVAAGLSAVAVSRVVIPWLVVAQLPELCSKWFIPQNIHRGRTNNPVLGVRIGLPRQITGEPTMLDLFVEHPWLIVVSLAMAIPILGFVFGTITTYLARVRRL